jgi:hypothetical protein
MGTGNNKKDIDNNRQPVLVNNSESAIIKEVLKRTYHKWWLILIIGVAGGIAGYIYAANKKPLFQSYLSFALDQGATGGDLSSAAGFASQLGISFGGAQNVFSGDNIIEIMLSRRIIEDVLLSVDTIDNKPTTLIEWYNQIELPYKKNVSFADIHFQPGELRKSFSYAKDSVLYSTYMDFKRTNIIARRPDKRLNIYELMVSSHNEKFSKIFTDKLIDKTNRFYTEITSKKARETLEILEKRVPVVKEKLDASISSKAIIQDANLNPAFANAIVPLLKEQSNEEVYGAAYGEMFKNLEIARFQYLKSIPLLQIIDPAEYPLLKIKPGKLKTSVMFSIAFIFIFILIFGSIQLFLSLKENKINS